MISGIFLYHLSNYLLNIFLEMGSYFFSSNRYIYKGNISQVEMANLHQFQNGKNNINKYKENQTVSSNSSWMLLLSGSGKLSRLRLAHSPCRSGLYSNGRSSGNLPSPTPSPSLLYFFHNPYHNRRDVGFPMGIWLHEGRALFGLITLSSLPGSVKS